MGGKSGRKKPKPVADKVAKSKKGGNTLPPPGRAPRRHSALLPPQQNTPNTKRKKGAKFNEVEDAYIIEHFGTLSNAVIAEKLGCSASGVRNRAKALGLVEAEEQKRELLDTKRAETRLLESAIAGDRLGALKALRDVIAERISRAQAKDVKGLSTELRAVMEEIELLEAPNEDEGDPLDVIRKQYAEGVPTPANTG